MEIGHIIAELRKQKRWTQSDLAEKLSVTKGAVGMWETNKRYPTTEKLIQLSQYFNVTTDYILGLTTENLVEKDDCSENKSSTLSFDGIQSYNNLTEREQEVVNTYRMLNKDNKDIIVGEMKKYLKEQKYKQMIASST